MALNLQSLVEQDANVRIEVTAADLKMFGESIAEQTIMTYKREIESARKTPKKRPIITPVR